MSKVLFIISLIWFKINYNYLVIRDLPLDILEQKVFNLSQFVTTFEIKKVVTI